MSFFYPQVICTLRVRWEDFQDQGDALVSKEYTLNVLARDVTVTINDYTKADTFSMTLDYSSFPFDPRCIRALGVTIHMEDMKGLFNVNKKSQDFNGANFIQQNVENTVFIGFADEENISFDDTNRTVSFEGRDYTALLIDSPYPGNTIDMGRPLDVIIKELLAALPTAKDITVENRTGAPLPTIGQFAPDWSPLGQDRSGKKKEMYWEVITDLVQRAALIAYIELDKLVITKPRVLYGGSKSYQFVYGKNLSNLSFKRKLGRQKGINIVVRSLNIEKKDVIEVRIPEEASLEWATELGIARARQQIDKVDKDGKIEKEDAPFMSFNVPNVSNTDQLREIAQGIYEEIGRQQIEGDFETREMALIQDGVEFDITKIRNGTPVNIEIDQGDLQGIGRLTSVAARKSFLIARGYESKVAAALAESLGRFKTTFYTRSVQFTINNTTGFKMKAEFVNFIDLSNKGIGS